MQPILEYAVIVWNNCTQANAELVGKVQVGAARIITELRVNSSWLSGLGTFASEKNKTNYIFYILDN